MKGESKKEGAPYRRVKGWRNRNRRTFNAQKKRNYRRGDHGTPYRRAWTTADLLAITSDGRPSDRTLAVLLRRSVQAIQVMRARIRAKTLEEKS